MVAQCYVLDVTIEQFTDDKGTERGYSVVKLLPRTPGGGLGDLVQLTGPVGLDFDGMADYEVTFKLSMRERTPRVQVVAMEKVGPAEQVVVPF